MSPDHAADPRDHLATYNADAMQKLELDGLAAGESILLRTWRATRAIPAGYSTWVPAVVSEPSADCGRHGLARVRLGDGSGVGREVEAARWLLRHAADAAAGRWSFAPQSL